MRRRTPLGLLLLLLMILPACGKEGPRSDDGAATYVKGKGFKVASYEGVADQLHTALQREVQEETGIDIRVTGLVGVYHNSERGIVNVVMRADATRGKLRTSDETKEAGFFALTPARARELVTRPHFLSRLQDAMGGAGPVYEAFRPRPYQLLERLGAAGTG